jgi:hypothetical protein
MTTPAALRPTPSRGQHLRSVLSLSKGSPAVFPVCGYTAIGVLF